MPVVIDEFEVLAEPGPGPSTGNGAGLPENAPPARPAQLQQALAAWARLTQERELRLDDH